jgi:hypothetical protein
MKNTDCVIYISTAHGRTVIVKVGDHWTMTSSRGRHFKMTAEQLLSHILPPLAGVSVASVRVERR